MSWIQFQQNNKVDLLMAAVSQNAGVILSTTYYSMANCHHASVIITFGVCAGTCPVQLTQKNSVTLVVKDITGKLQAASAGTVKILEVESSELDVQGGFDQIGWSINGAGGGALISMVLVRSELRWNPSSMIT